MKNKDRIFLGGFCLDSIKESVKKECYESGDPENYFKSLMLAMVELGQEYEEGGFLDEDTST